MSNRFEVAYCFPSGDQFVSDAYRFLSSYLTFPGHCEHDLVILTDPGYEQEALELFCTVPNVRALATPDYARDLSRYEFLVKQSNASCCMMLGGTSYFRRPGWALRAFTAFNRLGSANLYGSCGHAGAPGVTKHLRSTGWWASPNLLKRYPYWPKSPAERYPAEHGHLCFSAWVLQQGGQCWVINFGSEFTLENPQGDPNGYARGNHSSLLIGDKLTRPPFMPFA